MEKSSKTWLTLLIGVAFVILGLLFMINSNAAMNILNIGVSIVFIFSGIITLIEYFRIREFAKSTWLLIIAVVSLIIGIILLLNANILAVMLPLILAIVILIVGIFLLFICFTLKGLNFSSWWMFLIASIVSILFAIFIFTNLAIGQVTITFFTGLYFLFLGIASISSFIIDWKKNK